MATLVGPQMDVKLWDRSGEYNWVTGSAQACWSKSGRCHVGFDLTEDNPMEERSKVRE